MARVLAIGANRDSALVDRPLVRMLAALPDGWTLLVDRCIGGASAGCIEAVLVHAGIGVALIDEAPGDASLACAALCRFLQRERFSDYFPGDLPVVAVDAVAEPAAAIGEQIAAAFEAAPRLSIADPDWAYAIIELIVESCRLDVREAQEAVEAEGAELVFHSAGALTQSSRTGGPAEAERERARAAGNALSPHRLQLVSLVPVWLLATEQAAPRNRWIMAAKWAGLAGAILAVAWGFGGRLEYAPHLVPASPSEIEEAAVSPPAVIEPAAFAGGARTELQSPNDLPRRIVRLDPIATAAPSASQPDAMPRPTAQPANSGRRELDATSRAKRASPSEAAAGATARRSAKASAAAVAVNRSAAPARRHVKCADWLHQHRPGGSDYRGPPVAACPKRR